MATNNSINLNSTIGSAGQLVLPYQPSFFGYRNANTGQVTGDATVYTLVCTHELYDIGNNYNLTIFTAPVAGKYKLNATALLYSLDTTYTFGQINIVTTSFTYFQRLSPSAIRTAATYATMNVSCLAAMAAGDTAYVTITVTGATGKQILVCGGAVNSVDCGSYFSGILIA